MVRVLLKERMRIGPKGQVVIPKAIRDAERLYPGSEVFVQLSPSGIQLEPVRDEDSIAVFEQIAYAGKNKPIDAVHGYEEELGERWQRAKRST